MTNDETKDFEDYARDVETDDWINGFEMEMVCSTCGGAGEIETPDSADSIECPDCKGTGEAQ